MGYHPPEIAPFVTPVTFCLPKSNQSRSRKLTGREPNASTRIPACPSLGKESDALFFWLVLLTPPYNLIMTIL